MRRNEIIGPVFFAEGAAERCAEREPAAITDRRITGRIGFGREVSFSIYFVSNILEKFLSRCQQSAKLL